MKQISAAGYDARPECSEMTDSGVPDLPGSDFSRSFGSEALRYDRYRPSYPVVAIEHALRGARRGRVLDLGAGTGKLAAALVGRASEVLAVEPDEKMRAVLAQTVPSVTALAGSAEDIPLPDTSVDAVLAGQAFHWFRRPHADHEIARILRPGGAVGLIWNYPDRDVEWVPKLYRATGDGVPPWTHRHEALDPSLFTMSTEAWFGSSHHLDGPDGLLNLVHTWSWVITRPASEHVEIDNRVRAIVAEYPQLQGPDIVLPQQTLVVRCRRRR